MNCPLFFYAPSSWFDIITIMDTLISLIKKLIPGPLFRKLSVPYHFLLAWLGAVKNGHPSRDINIIAVTGTKGKSSVVEITNAVLEGAGLSTAVSGTVQFKIGDWSEENKFKQTMPGRFFLQNFIKKAADQNIDWMILEATSEGAKQFRNRFINLNALIFTNLAPEHIESHGGYENYKQAKLSILRNSLEKSNKRDRHLLVNGDDKEADDFLNFDVEHKHRFELSLLSDILIKQKGVEFTYKDVRFISPLSGEFNVKNLLSVIMFGEGIGIKLETMQKTIAEFKEIPGRVQRIEAGQNFEVIVDYAHTPDSLEAIYKAFDHAQNRICILGNTGGGRDQWKRPVMAKIADTYCDEIILTNEDPYDEDPLEILEQMREAITETPYEVVFDRRNAIFAAVERAKKGDAVMITGKGTDAFIMGPQGTKIPWSDSAIAQEALDKRMGK